MSPWEQHEELIATLVCVVVIGFAIWVLTVI
jgi:hypothetical protein